MWTAQSFVGSSEFITTQRNSLTNAVQKQKNDSGTIHLIVEILSSVDRGRNDNVGIEGEVEQTKVRKCNSLFV